MIFERHSNLKYKFGNRHFWCRGYYVDTVGRNKIDFFVDNELKTELQNKLTAGILKFRIV